MTVMLRVPSVRSLALVFAGVLLGTLLVAPVLARGTTTPGAIEPAVTTYARTASCAALSFHPIDSRTGYGYGGGTRLHVTGFYGSPGYFACEPGLPNKAVVTRVRFTVDDPSSFGEVANCALARMGLAATSADSVQVLARVPTTGSGTMPGTVRLSTTSISYGTIDHAKFAYWLQCQLTSAGEGPGAVGFYGADVTYTITAANG